MKPVALSVPIFTATFLITLYYGVFAQNKTYDIRHYDLEIKPDFTTKTLNVKSAILIDNPELQDEILLGLNDCYDIVKIASNASVVEVNRSPGWINIKIKKPTREITLVIELRGAPGSSNDEDRTVIADSSVFLLWSDRFYPIDFNDWATVRSCIVLPAGFRAIAPGRITNIRNKNGKVEYVWETSNPAVCFSVLADSRWIKTEREINGLRMQTLLYSESQKFAEQIFSTSREILRFYSKTYCPYPFDQFCFDDTRHLCATGLSGFCRIQPSIFRKGVYHHRS
ncbi:MAG: hypothetical protein ACE5NG_15840 [bacterium]